MSTDSLISLNVSDFKNIVVTLYLALYIYCQLDISLNVFLTSECDVYGCDCVAGSMSFVSLIPMNVFDFRIFTSMVLTAYLS